MEQERRELRTRDGRRLVFHVAGPEDGELLVFHTGTPGSPYISEQMVRECGTRGLRVLCVARPGYAGSDRKPGRSYAENPGDTLAVIDLLGVERVYVLGHSGGAPPALADAALLTDRVLAVAASASFSPRDLRGDHWMEGTGNKNVEEFEAVAAGGLVLQRYLEKERAAYRQIQTEEELLEGFEGFVCQRDREILNGEFLEFQLTSCRLIAGDGIWGWYDDDLASWKPWNFDPAKISVPLSIWHGEDDLVLPIAEGKFLAKLMPDANPHWLPGQGHFSLYPDHFGEILDELIALGLTS